MEIKEIIINKFQKSSFVYYDDIPMDSEIAQFIFDLNKSSHIITTNSCAGHDKYESGAQYDFISHPYLAFIVDEIGWNLFWQYVLPIITSKVLIHISTIIEDFDIAREKAAIIIRCHYEDKKQFWDIVQPTFLSHFR